jgi:hypothetical protein
MSHQQQNFRPNVDELRQRGSHWWPPSIRAQVAESSPAEFLTESLNDFNLWLDEAPRDPDQLHSYLLKSKMELNLVLKHLMVLLDQGGERINRYSANREDIFAKVGKTLALAFLWQGQQKIIQLQAFSARKSVNNQALGIQGSDLGKKPKNPALCGDVIKILIYGQLCVGVQVMEVFAGCVGIDFLGDPDFRTEFQSSRYIAVSRITSGATANSSGQALQSIVEERLRALLPPKFEINKNFAVDIFGERTTSDVFVSWPGGGGVGIEVAFQETTNSTIERKGNEARKRQESLHSKGIHACYVIDGEGCFQRASAVQKICLASDCTIAFGDEEFQILANYIIGVSN